MYERIDNLGYKFKISPAAKNFIAEKGYDIQYGARPLKRAIQKYLEDPMAETIIKSDIKEDDIISVGYDSKKEQITIKVTKPKEEKKKSTKEETGGVT